MEGWYYFLRMEGNICTGTCATGSQGFDWPDYIQVDEDTYRNTDVYMHCQQCDQQFASQQLTTNIVFALRVCEACNAKLPQTLCDTCEGACCGEDDQYCKACGGTGHNGMPTQEGV